MISLDLSVFLIAGMMGAMITFLLANTDIKTPFLKGKVGAVFASATLSFLVYCIVSIFSFSLPMAYVKTVPIIFFGASFAGMSSIERMRNWKWAALSGILFTIFFVNTSSYFAGYGGGLGTTAFISVFIVLGLMEMLDRFSRLLTKA